MDADASVGDRAVKAFHGSTQAEAIGLISSGLVLLGSASTGLYTILKYREVMKLTETANKCVTAAGAVMPPLAAPKDAKAFMMTSYIAHPMLALFGMAAIVLGVGHMQEYSEVKKHHLSLQKALSRKHLRGIIVACGVLTGVSAAVPLVLGKRLQPALDQAYAVVAADPVAGAVADLPPEKTIKALWWSQIGFAAAGALNTGYGIYLLTGKHVAPLAQRILAVNADMSR